MHVMMRADGPWFNLEDARAAFNLFCCVYGIGTLGMPANFARAGPVFATLALAFMAFCNVYASVMVSHVMLAAPPSVRTYSDLGEWVMGKAGRNLVILSQISVCLLVPCAFLVLGGALLQVLFPDSFDHSTWIIFMALVVVPVCLVPTLKEGAGMAFAGCLSTILSDVIAIAVLVHEMKDHPSPPSPRVSLHQILTTFGNLSLAYGAAIVIPDLQRQHSQPERMPRVVLATLSFVSALFLALAGVGYSAAGCQISGNLLFSIAGVGSNGVAPLGFQAHRGAVAMAYLFMQVHITIAFSVLLHPAFYLAERFVFGMHLGENTRYHYVEAMIDKDETMHGDAAEQSDDVDLLQSTGRSDCYGTHNIVRYIALRVAIIFILVVVAIILRDHFLELADFVGASAISLSCLILPSVFYLKVFGKRLPRSERWLSITIACSSAIFSVYVVSSIAIGFSKPPKTAAVVFPFCPVGDLQMKPYYISQ